ncbi:hypothetical protein FGG08_001927 [Glutinoglossum americanum]|uniref:Arb2 domain-containing protein n=1 Tax=Glutinoglossum americanum TaxID=1670608 RepID=A0A9P8ICJ3_9PEZI|nr:hypothetical protein FGG08_001927 [Glutinoglossum americanum]
MSMFRAKRLDLGGFVNVRVIRDHTKRKVYEQNETERYLILAPFLESLHLNLGGFVSVTVQALRYIARNTTLPQRMRVQAQIQLSQMHAYTRGTQIKNRCIAGGKGRGVFRDFGMARPTPSAFVLFVTTMYRRVITSLPKEPEFPYDLAQLGYFIDGKDEVKSITNPEEDFKYKVTRNERYNDLRKEAYTCSSTPSLLNYQSSLKLNFPFLVCLRKVVLDRLVGMGMETIRLPLDVEEGRPHIPILVSGELQKKNRVLLVFGSPNEDLGIWCYRKLGSNGSSINAGSAIDLIKQVRSYHVSETEAPGVIIANIGQLVWHRKGRRAVTFKTWHSMPRKSAISKGYRIDDVKNRVPGNEGPVEHIQYIFNTVITKLVGENAGLDIIAIGGMDVLRFLDDNWATWKGRINAIALTNPLHWMRDISDEDFRYFLKNRGRGYIVCDEPIGHLLYEPRYGCAVYSSGESEFSETILSATSGHILDFFHAVATDPNFVNPEPLIPASEEDTDPQGVEYIFQERVAEGLHGREEDDISTPIAEDMAVSKD